MQDIAKLIDSMFSNAVDYSRTTIEIIKLKTVDKVSEIISSTIPRLIVFSLIAFALLFLNLGLGFWLSEVLGKIYLGFLIVGGFYLLIGIIILLFLHKKIKKSIRNYLIKQLLK